MVTVVPVGSGASWTDWIGVVISLLAFAVAFAAWRSQVDPEVVVYANADPRRPTIVTLVIENMGRGIARDVRFRTSQAVPHLAFGIGENAKVSRAMTDGPIVHGIAFLHPGERRVITWGQYHSLRKSLNGCIDFTATYRSKPPYWLVERSHTTVSTVDIESFKYEDISDQNWDKHTAEALKELVVCFGRITDRSKGAVRVLELEDDGKVSFLEDSVVPPEPPVENVGRDPVSSRGD